MNDPKIKWPRLRKEDRVESLDELAEQLSRDLDKFVKHQVQETDFASDLIGQRIPSKVLEQSREYLHGVMEYYWDEARTNGWDPANDLTQTKIFTYFLDFMKKKIKLDDLLQVEQITTRELYLKKALHDWIDIRDSTLIKYTNELNAMILKSLPQLRSKRYLVVKAISNITGEVGQRIVPVDSYQNEQSLDQLMNEQKEKYFPKIENTGPDDQKILSVSNAIAYFKDAIPSDKVDQEPRKKSRKQKKNPDNTELDYREDFRKASYIMLSRNKRGPREKEKFVDWLSGLRLLDEFPYDGIGVTLVPPSEAEIYDMREIAKEITIGTAEKRKQNRYDMHGNLPSKYNKGEFKKIINAMKETELIVRNKMKNNPSYLPSDKEYEILARWFADKQIINKQRIETQFLSKYVSSIRDEPGAPLYHSGPYEARRKKDREEKIANPAMTVARDDKYRVREAKIVKSKPKINILIKDLEDYWDDVYFRTAV